MPLTSKQKKLLDTISLITQNNIKITNIQKLKLYHTLKHMLIEANNAQREKMISTLLQFKNKTATINKIIEDFSCSKIDLALNVIDAIDKHVRTIERNTLEATDVGELMFLINRESGYNNVKLLIASYLQLTENERAKFASMITIGQNSFLLSKIYEQHIEDNKFLLNESLYNEYGKWDDKKYKNHETYVLSQLQAKLARGADINYQNNDGYTALHIATILGYKEVVKMLLNNGADTSIKNKYGQTALDIANEQGYAENKPEYTEIAKMIKNHTIKPETKDSKDNNDADNSANDTDSKDAKGTSDSNNQTANNGDLKGQNNLSDMPGNVIDNNDSPITLTSNKENLLPSDTAEETSSKSYGAGKIKEEFNKKVEEFSNLGGKSLATFLQNQFTNFAELIEQLVKQEMSLEDLIKYGIKNIGVDYTKLENSDDSYYRDNSPMAELPPLGKTFDQHLPGLNTAVFNTDLS